MRYVKSLGLMAALMWAVTSPASAQSTNWTGAYVGINAGGSSTGYTSALQGFPGNFVNADHDSVIAGLHGGLQYQFGSFVLGLEASYSSTDGFSGFGDRVAGGTSDCLIAKRN